MPVVLCDLEGLTHEEAAHRLNLPAGTVKSRLSRARRQLRSRLSRRGLSPAELLATGLPARSFVPDALVDSTVRLAERFLAGQAPDVGIAAVSASVAALTQGVITSMFLTKLKILTAGSVIALTTGALLVHQATAQRSASEQTNSAKAVSGTGAPTQERKASDSELDILMLERAWIDALGRRDASAVGRILADDFIGINLAARPYTKATYLKEVGDGDYASGAPSLGESSVRVFGGTAVLNCLIQLKEPLHPIRVTKVYVKEQGRWQCVTAHGSEILPGEPTKVYATGTMEGVMGPAQDEGKPMGMMSAMMGRAMMGGRMMGSGMGGMMGSGPAPGGMMGSGMAGMMGSGPVPGGMMGSGMAGRRGTDKRHMMMGAGNKDQSTSGDKSAGSPEEQPDTRAMMAGGAGGMMAMMQAMRGGTAAMRHVSRIRPRFECAIERIRVQVGEAVKKGDPLVDVFSVELARAKNDYLAKKSQWESDREIRTMRKKLFDTGAVSNQAWVDTLNEETKSRLALQTGRDNLEMLGLSKESIAGVEKEEGDQKARITLRSPQDGIISSLRVELGDLADTRSILVDIASQPAAAPGEEQKRQRR
jgi:hypothetical protein